MNRKKKRRSLRLKNPYKKLNYNPYNTSKKISYKQKGVCGIKYTNKNKYILKNYSSRKAAKKDGAIITHMGQCGLCSTLKDLKVYKKYKNLTKPVKQCALKGFFSKQWETNCLKKLGFSEPCAQIWFLNIENTRKQCLLPCLLNINSKYNKANLQLNPCLNCDELKSGPIFKKFAGRTRRNSGVRSAIKRKRISRLKSKRKKK